MDDALAHQLARHGVATREDLAELAVDDMREICDVDEARAGTLIMEARKIWFEDEAQASAPVGVESQRAERQG